MATSAGFILVMLALRGRRIDDHPLCRRCGFDLTGRPAHSMRCPECGADLARERAIRIGRRRSRRGMLGVALPLLLLGAGGLGFVAWSTARNVDWERHKPSFWLIHDIRSKNAVARDAALAELIRRLDAGQLPQKHIDALTERALEYQGNVALPWISTWGDAIEHAHAAGKLPKEKWQRYVIQSVSLQMTTRARVCRGDPLPVHISRGRDRASSQHFIVEIKQEGDLLLSGFAQPYRVSDEPGPDYPPLEQPLDVPSGSGFISLTVGRIYPIDKQILGRLRDGPQTASMRLTIYLSDPHGPVVHDSLGTHPPRLTKTSTTISSHWTLQSTPTVTLVTDPALRDGVRDSLKYHDLTLDANRGLYILIWGPPPPVDLAFRVFLRDGSHERSAGSYCFATATRRSTESLGADLGDWKGDSLDVILRPDIQQARSSDNLYQIWGEEVVIPHVPVKRER